MNQNDLSAPNPSTPPSDTATAAERNAAPRVVSGWRKNAAHGGLLLLSLFVFFWRLGSARLFDLDEGVYVSAAKQMALSGDYITPRLNSRPLLRPTETLVYFYEKPILVYWLCAGSLRLFGMSEWAARVPVALAGLAATWLIVLMGTRWFHSRAGLLAGLVYALSPLILIDSRQMTTDNLLSLWFLIAMYAFWSLHRHAEQGAVKREEGREEFLPPSPVHKTGLVLMFWTACALAVLTKGVVGLLLPGLVIGVTLLLKVLSLRIRWRRGRSPLFLFRLGLNRVLDWWPTVRALYPLPGLLLFLVLIVPWHLAIWKAGGQDANGYTWVQEYIIRQHVGRFKGVDTVHNAPLPTFFAYFLIGFFPWACFTPAAFRISAAESASERQTYRFLLIWFWTIFLFFSLGAAKLPTYIAPAYPAAALLVGRWLERRVGREDMSVAASNRSLMRGALGAVITTAVLLMAALLLKFYPRLSLLAPAQVARVTLHLTGLLFVGCLAAWFCFRRGVGERRWRQTGVGVLVAMMLGTLLIFSGEGYETANRCLLAPYQSLASMAEADGKQGVTVLFYNIIPRRPSMLYYAGDYSPLERAETPILPYLRSIHPAGRLNVDIVTLRSTLEKQFAPEMAADGNVTYQVLAETGEKRGGWVLLRVRSL